VLLPALELLERADPRVGIVERGDEAERDLAAGLVIEEPATPGAVLGQRPALGMNDLAGFVPFGSDVSNCARRRLVRWPRAPSANSVYFACSSIPGW
jgi:hypothetical protein